MCRSGAQAVDLSSDGMRQRPVGSGSRRTDGRFQPGKVWRCEGLMQSVWKSYKEREGDWRGRERVCQRKGDWGVEREKERESGSERGRDSEGERERAVRRVGM